MAADRPLWTPSPVRVGRTRLSRFVGTICHRYSVPIRGYDDLYDWSLAEPSAFWGEVWDDAGIIASTPPQTVLRDARMPGAVWFEGARLNFAENLLRRRDRGTALVGVHESGRIERITHAELRQQVGRFQAFLRARGVGIGDRVVGLLPNRIEAVVAMLATTGLGAVWSSCSPDFGSQGVRDRFGQIAPKVLISCDGYTYGKKRHSTLRRIVDIVEQIGSIHTVVIVDVLGLDSAALPAALTWKGVMDGEPAEPHFEQLPPDHPVYILYSSGTTGVPKCIVHGAAGTLVQHAKELLLHADLRQDDTLFYFTTCGWMMWNWMVSGLLAGARIVLYDGSPASPDLGVLWRMSESEGVTHFGTSPKFLSALEKARYHPTERVDLSRLRVLLSTGAPLPPRQFEWVYKHVKRDLQLASICGGTDIVSCFMLGSPNDPVFAGEIQKRGLGMAVEAWDEHGAPTVGAKGELVCTAPFPSMPVGFWGDKDGSRYRAAYFDHFPGVWRHGDFVEVTERGGVVVHGRSDATLNPGGVRIGTAEIYRVVEGMEEVTDSLVVGLPDNDDVRVVLYVVLRAGVLLDEQLTARIRAEIRSQCTPRHVPAEVIQTTEIPRTISGKKVEIAVSRALQGLDVPNRDALANPAALDAFTTARPSA